MRNYDHAELVKISTNNSQKKIAVIFIHGRGGDYRDTWRPRNSTETIYERLAKEKELQSLEFYSFKYRTGLKPLQYDFKTIAKLLYSDIEARLNDYKLLFVVHSMGGLIAQQYIIDRYLDSDEFGIKAVKGVLYLATPFQGSGWANVIHPFTKWIMNKQIDTLRRRHPFLKSLERDWNKFVYRGGAKSLSPNMVHSFSQVLMRGVRDRVVASESSSPLYIEAKVLDVDTGHVDIAKMIDTNTTIYRHIYNFLIKECVPFSIQQTTGKEIECYVESQTATAQKYPSSILYVHGYDKQKYEKQAHIEMDFRRFFDIKVSPRRMPSPEEWQTIRNEISTHATKWIQSTDFNQKQVRIYGKMSLSLGLMLGHYYAKNRSIIVEVEQGDMIWSTNEIDPAYKVHKTEKVGSNLNSTQVVVIINASGNIEVNVNNFIQAESIEHFRIIQISPQISSGREQSIGHNSLKNGQQAAAYAFQVKNILDDIKQEGIQSIHLFINGPLGLAIFIGHFLSVVSTLYVYEFTNPSYIQAYKI
ncbi:SAVED domain-containing protein [Paenibacillus wenxiniae]|uniref:SAVED domain-containing protein n=1 Tax=Paenibacillus wenxiniae TaxID=1636843 RepID=A0ABW4RGW8_9BACL